MIISSILLIFTASFAFYNTSKKATLFGVSVLEIWIQQHTLYSKIISCLLLIAALIFVIFNFGITSGIIFWLITLMSTISLIIIISPLQKVNYKHIIVVFFILIMLEFSL